MQNLINMQISSIHSSPLSSLCPLAALSAADLSLAGTAWPDVLMVPLQLWAPKGSSEPPQQLCAPPLIPAQQDSELHQRQAEKLVPTTLGWCTKCQWWYYSAHSPRIFGTVLCSKSCWQGLSCPSSAVEAWHKTLTQGLQLNVVRKIRAWLAEGFRALIWDLGSGNPITTTPTGIWGCCISDLKTESDFLMGKDHKEN